MRNVLEYLEHSARIFPDKIAAQDQVTGCSYKELLLNAKRIGSFLSGFESPGNPVVVFMDKSVEALTAFLGIVYAGCFYVFISPGQPVPRIRQIMEVLKAGTLITMGEPKALAEDMGFTGNLLDYHEMIHGEIKEEDLSLIRDRSQDIDPLYCNFTSGSTGIPKGVLVSHRSVIDFMEYFPSMFGITSEDIIGNQAPFDFDVSVKDIYSTLKTGATMVMIPKKLFSIPTELLDYLWEHKVTTLIWAVSALCLIAQLKGFTYKVPSRINKVLFSGEAMPVKHLAVWQKYLPGARYVNLYGPTEITCNCTYYPVDRKFEAHETLPIGRAFPNEKVFLLDQDDRLVTENGRIGEICVSGTALALGYYNNPEQTKRVFVQNPLNTRYLETIYRTGDLAFYQEKAGLCFAGRKDFQIKHMGHRIELEEIEAVLNSYPLIERACCVFDDEKNKITAFYVGNMNEREISIRMRESLPVYMIPSGFCPLPELPVTPNGKMDRKKLLEMGKGKQP
ncbi:amino acid adenylation domain-containing protein [Lacrimispora saccharolytica]|uniref:AMP-dependent synthetase and ligase n=1 Tax=Lacrimispora saccharolytica (strain ATCC 35040 / DSM 2544 / NRCC 2533 / WM1) TaxID=610130 RepID=D9R5J9_LACSW|nr:amino acid adenylation domain-containing protein [Lacrimispora saccharolytica]ADL05182.1 AMP-dependent synthetase and ligase [[Clostridium] saccharolyticum WM1]QRV20638.1 amino acid adenylation domain-containing protein [Lacrimispora saccharolytica]